MFGFVRCHAPLPRIEYLNMDPGCPATCICHCGLLFHRATNDILYQPTLAMTFPPSLAGLRPGHPRLLSSIGNQDVDARDDAAYWLR